jgi:hypothetical protein
MVVYLRPRIREVSQPLAKRATARSAAIERAAALAMAAPSRIVKHNSNVRRLDEGRCAPAQISAPNLKHSSESFARACPKWLERVALYGHRVREKLVPAATARASAPTAAAAFARLVAVPAKHRPVSTRLERHCCGLAATGTNHRCSLCWSRTVAGAPLIVLLCLTAILATLRGRVAAFLKERLIRSGEGKILPAIAARK